MEVDRGECLNENVGWLFNSKYGLKVEGGALEMVGDKVTIILDVFGSFMKNIIMSNLNSTTIVIMK